MIQLNGRFWLEKDGKSFLGAGRIELLKRIEKSGSMNAAAKEMKMSYKAAWDRLNAMNELAKMPLLERQTGGKGGGGTKLTPYAHEMIETYEKLEALHKEFIARFSEAGDSPEHLAKILNRHFLTTSARNQLLCEITQISYDNIYAKITLRLGQTQKLISTITTKSMQNLNLKVGDSVYAIVKSSDVKVSQTPPQNEASTNILIAKLHALTSNDSKSELSLLVDEHKELIALLPLEESKELQVEQQLYVCIDPSAIIIGM